MCSVASSSSLCNWTGLTVCALIKSRKTWEISNFGFNLWDCWVFLLNTDPETKWRPSGFPATFSLREVITDAQEGKPPLWLNNQTTYGDCNWLTCVPGIPCCPGGPGSPCGPCEITKNGHDSTLNIGSFFFPIAFNLIQCDDVNIAELTINYNLAKAAFFLSHSHLQCRLEKKLRINKGFYTPPFYATPQGQGNDLWPPSRAS